MCYKIKLLAFLLILYHTLSKSISSPLSLSLSLSLPLPLLLSDTYIFKTF